MHFVGSLFNMIGWFRLQSVCKFADLLQIVAADALQTFCRYSADILQTFCRWSAVCLQICLHICSRSAADYKQICSFRTGCNNYTLKLNKIKLALIASAVNCYDDNCNLWWWHINNNNNNLLNSQWIYRGTVALWVEETKSQTESQHIKPNIGFPWGGKTRVLGEKPLLKNWVEKQQSQPTYQYEHGSGNRPPAISVEGVCTHHFTNPTKKLMILLHDNEETTWLMALWYYFLTDSLSMNKHLHLSLAFILQEQESR